MRKNLDINIHHLTRVEGHGNIVVNMREGRLERAELEIVEAMRYFEAMLKGRSFHEAAIITSRICGICSPDDIFKSNRRRIGFEDFGANTASKKIVGTRCNFTIPYTPCVLPRCS
jgi:hypothetical protein